ncbi:hypothetical protein VTK73DRAFT_3094 [Phialemonium thermophilum]|uniref:Zn(2)-C6 fungal-type domain-containing protein n=1 Tax=Phialemonium thermophilum TaxID=223376 RepID=A0ABR3X1F0_9PEZI
MPAVRSRQGCEECRRRRRKCDERKPRCGPCSNFDRGCHYPLRLVWGTLDRKYKRSAAREAFPRAIPSSSNGTPPDPTGVSSEQSSSTRPARSAAELPVGLPQSLPNGIPLPSRYQRLLSHFMQDILARLSCHPSIHEDLRQGLVPVALESPQLMSACLALSAAGFLSRGVLTVEGVDVARMLSHLQSSGLALLRSSLQTSRRDEILLVTCLVWCLADVFSYRRGTSSWRIHLQGIQALLEAGDHPPHRDFVASSDGGGVLQSATRHLYQLYLCLRTLPHIPLTLAPPPPPLPPSQLPTAGPTAAPTAAPPTLQIVSSSMPRIDGFLGYSEELLDILQQINQLSRRAAQGDAAQPSCAQADLLLGKLKAMISRDSRAAPAIAIRSPLSPEYGREFTLCHQTFQQATLIHLYRRLYHLPSRSPPIQDAVRAMQEMIGHMSQGEPCHAWAAMAMPLFTLGCEAFTEEQKNFALDKVNKLEQCIRSLHIEAMRQALNDVWNLRASLGDFDGELCAGQLLEKVQYNVILF